MLVLRKSVQLFHADGQLIIEFMPQQQPRVRALVAAKDRPRWP